MTLERLQALRKQAENDMPLYWALTALISLHLGLPEAAELELGFLEKDLKVRQQ